MEKKVMKINAVGTTISVALTAACAATATGQVYQGKPGAPSTLEFPNSRTLPAGKSSQYRRAVRAVWVTRSSLAWLQTRAG